MRYVRYGKQQNVRRLLLVRHMIHSILTSSKVSMTFLRKSASAVEETAGWTTVLWERGRVISSPPSTSKMSNLPQAYLQESPPDIPIHQYSVNIVSITIPYHWAFSERNESWSANGSIQAIIPWPRSQRVSVWIDKNWHQRPLRGTASYTFEDCHTSLFREYCIKKTK